MCGTATGLQINWLLQALSVTSVLRNGTPAEKAAVHSARPRRQGGFQSRTQTIKLYNTFGTQWFHILLAQIDEPRCNWKTNVKNHGLQSWPGCLNSQKKLETSPWSYHTHGPGWPLRRCVWALLALRSCHFYPSIWKTWLWHARWQQLKNFSENGQCWLNHPSFERKQENIPNSRCVCVCVSLIIRGPQIKQIVPCMVQQLHVQLFQNFAIEASGRSDRNNTQAWEK